MISHCCRLRNIRAGQYARLLYYINYPLFITGAVVLYLTWYPCPVELKY
jgi:hypothetical protein